MYTMTLEEDYTVTGAPVLRLYDPTLTEYGLESPTLELEANRIGTLTFTIYDSNPQYAKIKLRRSLIRVYRDGEIQTIMRPIIKHVNMRGGYEYTCEELTGFLNDILKRPEASPVTATAHDFLYDNIEECEAKAGGENAFVPRKDYFRSIMLYNEQSGTYSFKYLRGTSDLFPSPFGYPDPSGSGTIEIYNRTNASVDLRRALAAVTGSSETGWVPTVTGEKLQFFPYEEVIAYGKIVRSGHSFWESATFRRFADLVMVFDASQAAERELYNNWRYINTGSTAVRVNGKTLYETLRDEMADFIANLPDDDDEWGTGGGFPVSFVVGEGDTPASGEEFETQAEDYVGYWDYIQEKLIDVYGGYIVPVWGENSVHIKYMDELDLPQSSQSITFGENLDDLFTETDCSEQYTTIIPLGKDGLTITQVTQDHTDFIADDASYGLYGRKEVIKEWPDITDAQILYNTAIQWLLDHSMLLKDHVSVTAYDLRLAGLSDTDYLDFMHMIPVTSLRHGIEASYPITQATIVMDSPSANAYTLGSEPDSLVDDVAEQQKKLDRIRARSPEQLPTLALSSAPAQAGEPAGEEEEEER